MPEVVVPALPYEKSPSGSDDNYRTTRTVVFYWTNPPARYWNMIKPVETADGAIWRELSPEGERRIALMINPFFCFDVSVAPSFPKAMPAACVHDWIYKWVTTLAIAWGVRMRDVLTFANHWFLSLMRYTKFALKFAYYSAVCAFGEAYHVIGTWFK